MKKLALFKSVAKRNKIKYLLNYPQIEQSIAQFEDN